MRSESLEYHGVYINRSGRHQVSDVHADGVCVATHVILFPNPFDLKGKVKEHHSFWGNSGTKNEINKELKGFKFELVPDPYADDPDNPEFHPEFDNSDEAIRFLDSDAFVKTWKGEHVWTS